MKTSEHLRNQSLKKVNISKRQQAVIETIKQLGGKATNAMISKTQNQPINRITGRVKELSEIGIIEFDMKVYDTETKRFVSLWRLSNIQLNLF